MNNMKTLIIVDAQNDFIAGSLPVPNAEKVVENINAIIPKYDNVIFTMDWHPLNHCSFQRNGGEWPIHCLQGSYGAAIRNSLIKTCIDNDIIYKICLKGTQSEIEEYGAFGLDLVDEYDFMESHGFCDWNNGIDLDDSYSYDICGFAGDYCVKATKENLEQLGLNVNLIKDCTGYINYD